MSSLDGESAITYQSPSLKRRLPCRCGDHPAADDKMCGIAGFIDSKLNREQANDQLEVMLASLSHRGPDDQGVWINASTGLAMGHRRLAIRDITSAGRQPMISPSGRFTVTFNGEIYNVDQLRQSLPKNIRWRGHSDTEVLLHSIDDRGLQRTLSAVAGMFAIAIYDNVLETVTLIRDRLGIKPLYLSVQNNRICWSSELKAMLGKPGFEAEINVEALSWLFRFGYIPAPHSILHRVTKLQPGTCVSIPVRQPSAVSTWEYWSVVEATKAAKNSPLEMSDEEAVDETAKLLTKVTQQHMASDVPLGAFLSGGIDSTTVVALMQSVSAEQIKTFSIGFDDPQFDEAPYAKAVAAHLRTEHHERYVRTADIVNLVPRWAEFYCEPFCDTSGLPMLVVSREARHDVTVALTGDGGDELFGGYRRYQQTLAIERRIKPVPAAVRHLLKSLLSCPPAGLYDRLTPWQDRIAGRAIRDGLNESVRKARCLLSTRSRRELYECVASISYGANRDRLLRSSIPADSLFIAHDAWHDESDMLDNMQLWDTLIYLPNDILHKVDMASMSVGLEARVPLLDHRFFEWSWRLPNRLKANSSRGKIILRRILRRHVPDRLVNRPKRGFSAPLDDWLRGPLRDWAESLLSPSVLGRFGLLNQQTVRHYWHDLMAHRAGHARIWPVLVFLAWQEHYFNSGGPSDEHRVRHDRRRALSIGG